jgi:hypothetical protein
MRRNVVVPRTSMKVAAVALAGGLAVCACSTTQLGAAAITGSGRISAATLTSQVTSLNTAYTADKAKGIKPQRPVGQETQQVLSWLILFRVYDEMAAQHHIGVTRKQIQQAQALYTSQAEQSNVSLIQYWSAGAALPPDLLPDLYRAGAIETRLTTRLNGGKPVSSAAQQTAVQPKFSQQQCLAAKSLGITVNPQYGEYNYNGYAVVPAPSTLAANPIPSPAPTAVRRTPAC